jgi:hypothetical protein
MVSERIGALIGESKVSRIESGNATNLANFILFLFAYIFGNTSPNKSIRKVTSITSTINFKNGESISSKRFFPTIENNITTPMFIKLLATKRVASSFLGFSRSFDMILVFAGFSDAHWAKSSGVKEKYATSAAEMNAEQKSKIKMTIKPKSKLVSMVESKLKLGSRSKLKFVS